MPLLCPAPPMAWNSVVGTSIAGTTIPLPLSTRTRAAPQHPGTMFLQWWASSPIPTSKTSTGASHTDSTWNMILPAVMKFRRLALRVLTTIVRYDFVTSTADKINGFGGDVNEPIAPFFSPVHATRNRITPGIQFLIHANIKAAFEYQIRPQQAIFDPAGNPITKPFRTNSAVAGLEFVY